MSLILLLEPETCPDTTDLCKIISNRLHATCGGSQMGLHSGIHFDFSFEFYIPEYVWHCLKPRLNVQSLIEAMLGHCADLHLSDQCVYQPLTRPSGSPQVRAQPYIKKNFRQNPRAKMIMTHPRSNAQCPDVICRTKILATYEDHHF